jgi:hypothetical protein
MRYLLFLAAGLLLAGCSGEPKTAAPPAAPEPPTELPFTPLALADRSAFEPAAANWSIAGQVWSDHTREGHLATATGTGVLVNQPDATNRDHLFTTWAHGDLELKGEVMLPNGANSGLYFQGRYEIQLYDSWRQDSVGHADLGGIYERWDESRPEGQQGSGGQAPRQNVAKAPGLWQAFHIVFRAPRFDAAGNKVANARFERVVLNGVLIHENVEVTGPTRAAAFAGEAPTGPLMIQGDHGPVALRNIAYKRYFEADLPALNAIEYQYYEIDGPLTQLPDFDTLAPVRTGTTDSLVYQTLSERNERVAYVFSGRLDVAKAGDYLFTVYSDDGSRLFIDGAELIDNDGKHDYEPRTGLITLSEGEHDFQLRYFNNNWGQGLTVYYEGPEIRRRPLLSRTMGGGAQTADPLILQPAAAPEMVRSFLLHDGEKLTHTISVGDPSGLHYSVDLRRGALLQFWRGDFADVTEMWRGRGISQRLKPLEMAVAARAGRLAAVLPDPDAPWPTGAGPELRFRAYDLNAAQQPVFAYEVGGTLVRDHYRPDPARGEIIRTIQAAAPADNLYTRIASADYIKELGNGYYSVGGIYYLRLVDTGAEPIIRRQGEAEELLFSLAQPDQPVSYALLW